MSGQRDTDDLIAELSKLMASENGSDSGPGARAASPAATPVPSPAAARSTIRIPGLNQPVPAVAPQGARTDMGSNPQPLSEPRPSWQGQLGGRSSSELRSAPPNVTSSARQEPSLAAGNSRPADASANEGAAPTPGFDFDFGFNRERPEAPKPAASAPPAARPVPPPQTPVPTPAAAAPRPASQPIAPVPRPAPAPGHDPIADLIAAELDGQMEPAPTAPTPSAAPLPAPTPSPNRSTNFAAPVPAPVQQPSTPSVDASRGGSESDRFATAPVFGLGNRPAGAPVSAPKVELDPMDEIESLIGEAVRVELNMPQLQPQTRAAVEPPMARAATPPTPAVPPLSGQFAPRRTTSLREAEVAPGSPDEAILAAVAAGGAGAGRIDSAFAEDRPGSVERPSRRERQAERRQAPRREREYEEDERPSSAFKQLVVPAMAALVLVGGGFGAYWALGMNHSGGRVPILAADATPAKTIPPKPADSAPHSAVMDELSGNTPSAQTETLVSRDQTAGDTAAQVASQSAAPTADDGGLANRKVRTVTVRPDGTIVSGDDSLAGAAKLPVDRPNVPAVPGVSVANAADSASFAPQPAGSAMGATPGLGAGAPAAGAANAAAALGEAASATDPNAPVPLPRPLRAQLAATEPSAADAAAQPLSSVNAVRKPGGQPMDLIGNLVAQSDAGSSQSTQPANAGSGSGDAGATTASVAHVQLASQPSEAGAQASANSLQRRFGSLFGGGKLQIVKVVLSKGTYYRVMLPAASLQSAQQTCASIKASGGDCVVGNG